MIIKKDPAVIAGYLEDSSNLKGGHADEVALPKNAGELAGLLQDANSDKIPVTISGGGTGTTGSRIPFGGIAVSMEKFNKVIDISESRLSATLEAGVSVEELKSSCERKGLFYTSHPTEKAAFIGSTVATNASGSRSFKYGPTRRRVRRLKMLLASGEMLDIKRGEHVFTRNNSAITLPNGSEINIPLPTYRMPDVKSSAGYFAGDGMDLIDLFIGQEGTLSVIFEVELELVRLPGSIFSCFVFFRKEEDAWRFSEGIKNAAYPGVLSIEYFSSSALRLLRLKNSNIPSGADAAIFFEEEAGAGDRTVSADKWLDLISKHNASIDDTWVAMNEKDAAGFNLLRYSIPEAVNDIVRKTPFHKISTDIAVPGSKFFEMALFYNETLKIDRLEQVIFGHIGENHLHVNVLPRSADEMARAKEIALKFIRKGVSLGGTVSAEHGIGKIKHKFLEEMYGHKAILEMASIKKALDPNLILGRGNIFPVEIFDELV